MMLWSQLAPSQVQHYPLSDLDCDGSYVFTRAQIGINGPSDEKCFKNLNQSSQFGKKCHSKQEWLFMPIIIPNDVHVHTHLDPISTAPVCSVCATHF